MRDKRDYIYEYGPERANGGSDWGRRTPTKVDIDKVINRFPKHRGCSLFIKDSAKNSLFTGLYCRQHGTHLTWVNYEQEKWLNGLGITR